MVERIRFQSGLPPLAATEGPHKARRQQKDPSQRREKQAHGKKKRRSPSSAEEVDGADQAGANPTESEPVARVGKKTIDIIV
jgi:hypothetical protein